MELYRGLIVSIQGYDSITTETLAREAVNAGAVGIRTDKPVAVDVPIIGLQKINVQNRAEQAYITPTISDVRKVSEWAEYVAIDYRSINQEIKDISDYCQENEIKVIADIYGIVDYELIKTNNYYYDYIATTLSIYNPRNNRHYPDIKLLEELIAAGETKIIAEGKYHTRNQVESAIREGVNNICIGDAICNVYKLTKKYTGLFK